MVVPGNRWICSDHSKIQLWRLTPLVKYKPNGLSKVTQEGTTPSDGDRFTGLNKPDSSPQGDVSHCDRLQTVPCRVLQG